MKIITWNVNRFDGICDWYKYGDLPIEERVEVVKKIIEKISELLTTSDDIIILQEIPYRDADWNDEWKKNWEKYFENFKVMFWFKNEPKRKDFNYKYSKNVTIAVTKEESNWNIRPYEERKIKFKKTKGCYDYMNRYIELKNGELSILGFHLSMGKDGQEQWDQIHSVANNSEFSFIVGDFNVNDFLYPLDNELCELETKYNRLIGKDIITQNQALTSLDNIFVQKEICSGTKISVFDYCYISKIDGKACRNVRCSDHNVCVCEIGICV